MRLHESTVAYINTLPHLARPRLDWGRISHVPLSNILYILSYALSSPTLSCTPIPSMCTAKRTKGTWGQPSAILSPHHKYMSNECVGPLGDEGTRGDGLQTIVVKRAARVCIKELCVHACVVHGMALRTGKKCTRQSVDEDTQTFH